MMVGRPPRDLGVRLSNTEANRDRLVSMLKRAWRDDLPFAQFQPVVPVAATLLTGRQDDNTTPQHAGHDSPPLQGGGESDADGLAVSEWWFTSLRSTERNEASTSSEDEIKTVVAHSMSLSNQSIPRKGTP